MQARWGKEVQLCMPEGNVEQGKEHDAMIYLKNLIISPQLEAQVREGGRQLQRIRARSGEEANL